METCCGTFQPPSTANQPAADFLTNIEMLAKKAGLGDAQTVFAAVNGLTPVIRQAVLTKEANTMETVRKWATIAKGAVDSNPTTDITAMVADIQQKLTLMSVSTSEQRPPQRQRSQSPAPRVRFDDNDHNRRSPTPDTNRSRPQGSYRPTQQANNNRQFDRRPGFNTHQLTTIAQDHCTRVTLCVRRFSRLSNAWGFNNVHR